MVLIKRIYELADVREITGNPTVGLDLPAEKVVDLVDLLRTTVVGLSRENLAIGIVSADDPEDRALGALPDLLVFEAYVLLFK